MILLDAAGLTVTRPERPLFTDVGVTLASGDRLAVVGLNGCGKSTLLRVLAGDIDPAAGEIRRGRGSRVVAVRQDRSLPPGTVRAAVGAEGEGAWTAEAVADRLGLADLLDREVSTLSGGQVTRVALARALAEVGPPGEGDDAVLLILDEPTNHLDIDAIAWLEERLAAHRGGLLLVTHDRHVLDRVTTRILELDRGQGHVHDGGYASYLEARAVRAEQAATADARRRNLARRELAWLRRGAQARSTKAKARVDRATALVETRPDDPARASDDLPLHHGTPRLGDQVVELHGVGHRWDDGPWLFRGVDLALDPRERLGLVGPNGSGKSTLVDVLAGRRAPAEGRVVRGSTAQVAVYDQTGIPLDPGVRVADAVAGPHRDADWSDAALLEAFWFDADAQRAPIGLLSGGERRRLQLLLTLRARPNVLLLDEPTNDLDLDTLRVLEDFLDDWPGALVVVSHDRALLERTVTDVLVIDEHTDGRRLPGGYAAWEEQRREARAPGRAGGPSAGPASGGGVKAAPARKLAPPPSAPSSRRPRGHLHKLMKEAEGRMRRLERRRDELTEALAAGTADHRRMAEMGAELAAATEELAVAEDEWLTLADEADR